MLMDVLSINGKDPIGSFIDITYILPENVLSHSFKSDIDSGYKLMYYSKAYDGWLYLDSFEILQGDNVIVFHYKSTTALESANVVDRRSFEGWTTLIYPKAL